MKKHVVGLLIALLTFGVGLLVSKLFFSSTAAPSKSVVRVLPVEPVATRRPVDRSWTKVEIGKVSFLIPAYLKKTGPPGNVGVIEAYAGTLTDHYLYLYYAYGDTIPSDYNQPYGIASERLIDGKPATLYFADVEKEAMNYNDIPVMKLVVLDVGDGKTKFEWYLASFDRDLMRQVVDSVHIQP